MSSAPSPRDCQAGRTWSAARYQTCSRWTAIAEADHLAVDLADPEAVRIVAQGAAAECEEALAGLRRSRGWPPSPGSRARCSIASTTTAYVGRKSASVARRMTIPPSRSDAATSVTRLAWSRASRTGRGRHRHAGGGTRARSSIRRTCGDRDRSGSRHRPGHRGAVRGGWRGGRRGRSRRRWRPPRRPRRSMPPAAAPSPSTSTSRDPTTSRR